MHLDFKNYFVEPIAEHDAWKLCNFIVANSERLKRYFPITLEHNLNPDLSRYFVGRKIKQFNAKEEFLFKLKEKKDRTIIGLVYIKELHWDKKQAELAYCIGYQFEGLGMATETVKVLSKYAFETLELKPCKSSCTKRTLVVLKWPKNAVIPGKEHC